MFHQATKIMFAVIPTALISVKHYFHRCCTSHYTHLSEYTRYLGFCEKNISVCCKMFLVRLVFNKINLCTFWTYFIWGLYDLEDSPFPSFIPFAFAPSPLPFAFSLPLAFAFPLPFPLASINGTATAVATTRLASRSIKPVKILSNFIITKSPHSQKTSWIMKTEKLLSFRFTSVLSSRTYFKNCLFRNHTFLCGNCASGWHC